MFERFTDRARQVVVGAQAEALALNHGYIGTEHILLGMLRVGDGCAFHLLELFGVPADDARRRVEEIIGRGDGAAPSGHIPFTPRAKKVLEMSLREALSLSDAYIGSEHILLGLLREGEGVGAQVLRERGVTLAVVRERLGEVEREAPSDRGPEVVTADMEARVEAGLAEEGGDMIQVRAEDFARLMTEIARLRDLLRHHGIDPGEELPGFGED